MDFDTNRKDLPTCGLVLHFLHRTFRGGLIRRRLASQESGATSGGPRLARYKGKLGPLGVRVEGRTGHLWIAVDTRSRLGGIDVSHELVIEMFLG